MQFEYDRQKSVTNWAKHGISLEEAQQLWAVSAVEIKARTVGEERWMIIGYLQRRCYSCIFTMRQDVVRLISARRSRPNEERLYHDQIQATD